MNILDKLFSRSTLVMHPTGFSMPRVGDPDHADWKIKRDAEDAAKEKAERRHREARGPGKRSALKLTHHVFVEAVRQSYPMAPHMDRVYRVWCRDSCEDSWVWGRALRDHHQERYRDRWCFRFKSEADAVLFALTFGGVS